MDPSKTCASFKTTDNRKTSSQDKILILLKLSGTPSKMLHNSIVVVGSCMMDFVSYTSRLPTAGETLHGKKFVTNFGGKGANQCVAAAKLGGQTALVARVGDDVWGGKYIENLKTLNINSNFIKQTDNCSSGIAQIIVSDSGENQIVIVAGANNALSISDVQQARPLIEEAAVLVLQLETSVEVAIKSMELCKGISILNGAPAIADCNPALLKLPTIFCVNETEASVFTGLPVNSKTEAITAAKALVEKGCKSVLLTLGPQGAIYLDSQNNSIVEVASREVKCVDSTGAGDAFIGALAFLLANHMQKLSMEEAIEIACYVAADSVTKPGTQISFSGPEILQM